MSEIDLRVIWKAAHNGTGGHITYPPDEVLANFAFLIQQLPSSASIKD